MSTLTLGQLVRSYFLDHLRSTRGLRPSSIASYRDGIRLYLCSVAQGARDSIARLPLETLTADSVLHFLDALEQDRHNHPRTRNQRLAILHSFFNYIGGRVPEMLPVAEQVMRIPGKRVAPPETFHLEQRDVELLFDRWPLGPRTAARDRTLLLFLYNTGARAQEVADLRVGNLDLDGPYRVRLHGKGDKWRTCPLWQETATALHALLDETGGNAAPDDPVFRSTVGGPLTRFGIHKVVRRHAAAFDADSRRRGRRVTPHVFRHTTAVHLLEAGVEINVIRAWLGHARLETTNRYAEITARIKEAALAACAPPVAMQKSQGKKSWNSDAALLDWLDAL